MNISHPIGPGLTAIYDLACSPPSYDFLSFLCAAEYYRQTEGYGHIDMVFQPGPKDGFRDDDLPPDGEMRRGMLWRICVNACRLLPSVQSISVLSERKPIGHPVFPPQWAIDRPIRGYGAGLYKLDIPRVLRATEAARKIVKSRIQGPYVTITLRHCDYWPARNSNLPEWQKAAAEIKAMGYQVEILEDTSDSASMYTWDIDLRMALYEGAVCNLGVSNGPMGLLYVSSAPYLVFKLMVPAYYITSLEFLEKHNIFPGDQFGSNGRLIWEDDTADVIMKAFREFVAERTNTASIQTIEAV